MSSRMPSTPNARSLRTQQSTTPRYPPPGYLTNHSNVSTTPAGNPPHSVFGSSFNPSNNTFGGKTTSFEVPNDEYSDDEDAEGEMEEDTHELDMQSLPRQSLMSSLLAPSPRGVKRSYNGQPRPDSGMADIARGMLGKSKVAELKESDKIIVESEELVANLDMRVARDAMRRNAALTETAASLARLWSLESDRKTASGSIGPASKDSFTKANYLANLLMQLYLPHTNRPGGKAGSVPTPKALLEWLDAYHRPFPDEFEAVRFNDPTPAARDVFWDAVFASLLRGKLSRAIDLLQNAGMEYAATAEEEDADGYSGQRLANAQMAVRHCVDVLESCPGLKLNNWDVKGMEWTLFRERVRINMNDLDLFSGNDGSTLQESHNSFARSLGNSMSLSTATKKANSKVPWPVYENLQTLYHLLLGSESEILMLSQDWLEGALYLTIWWDGSFEGQHNTNLNTSSIRKSRTQTHPNINSDPRAAYREKLADAFVAVTSQDQADPVFTVNTMELIQVGVACVFEDKVGVVVNMLKTWSMPIGVSVVEIATLDGWVPVVRPRSRDGLLNESNLMALSSSPEKRPDRDAIDRDELLGEFSGLLANKAQIDNREGWELAVAVLNRLDQASEGHQKISDLLDQIHLTDESRVDKILGVCDQLGLKTQKRGIAERFADSLGEKNENYGAALIYYARALATEKLKNTIVLLTSLCLLHSASIPVQQLLDSKLESLLSKRRQALRDLAMADAEAATLLSTHLSGYATLRKFYDLRDQNFYLAAQKEPPTAANQPLKPLERRREAASALFAVASSAADCISGGLYDPSIESVISPDGLLVLFGEALPLLGQNQRIFSEAQIFSLLATLDDFTASPSRIRENAASLLAASVNAYRDGVSSASGSFRKPRSDLSASNSWEMLASQSMLAQSQGLGKMNNSDGKIERAWDWRQGLVGLGDGAEADVKTVLRLAREALVKEVAGGWGGRLNWG